MNVCGVETVSEQDISWLMVRGDVILDVKEGTVKLDEALVKTEGLVVVSENGKHAVDHVPFSLRRGEVLGIAGVEGNGQMELVRVITGIGTYSHSAVEISGQDIKGYSVGKIRNLKLIHIPADRMAMGMTPRLSITENMIAGKLGWKRFFKKDVRDKWAIKEYGEEVVKQYLIFCKFQGAAINSLSGGNIQKAILARELPGSPQIIIADQPTRDMDAGVMEFIHQCLIGTRDEGNGVILVTSDLNEVLGLSDGLIVMYEGRIVAYISDASKMMEARLGTYILGIRIQFKEGIEEMWHEQQ